MDLLTGHWGESKQPSADGTGVRSAALGRYEQRVKSLVEPPRTMRGNGFMKAGEKRRKGAVPAQSLKKVLEQNEDVKSLVQESAGDLTAVNRALKDEIAAQGAQPGVEEVLEKSEAVEKKVHEASDKLATVNRALQDEIKDRHVLEVKLAEVTEQEASARHVAFHDPLTGLPNRALFKDRLELGLAQAKRHDWSLAVMFMDLDGFKNINDTFGHQVGDYVLQTIAGRLRENTRVDDTVSRLGGDEFTYLLMEAGTQDEIAIIAQKMIKAIQAVRSNNCLI
jgi:diguanylate cyclase (GGDEF)-like protein